MNPASISVIGLQMGLSTNRPICFINPAFTGTLLDF